MKKLCLVLAFFTVFSTLPVSAAKYIVNHNNYRIVYSRSTCPTHDMDKVDYSKVYKQNSYSEERLRTIGNAIKPEFVGIIYDFSDSPKPDENYKKINPGYDAYEVTRAGKISQEATDYYTFNDIEDKMVPSWEDGYY